MLLRRMVNARRTERLSTASRTTELEVKMRANLSWRPMISTQKKSPITSDVIDDTMVANRAPFPLPAPSSLATRTLQQTSNKSIPILISIAFFFLYA
jgi:hypothetical protein